VIFQKNVVYKDLMQRKEQFPCEEDDHVGSYIYLDLEAERDISSGGEQSQAQVTPATRGLVTSTPPRNETDDIEETDVHQSPLSYHLVQDRERRVIRAPRRFDDEDYFVEALYTSEDGDAVEPADYKEAVRDENWDKWKLAMNEETESQLKNDTWTKVTRPEKQRIIGSRWIYKYKRGIPRVEEPRFKARLVAKGYAQRKGVDYHEIFAPVVKQV